MYKVVVCVDISLGKCVVRVPRWHFFKARAETGARKKLFYGGGARKITALLKYIAGNNRVAQKSDAVLSLRPFAALSLTLRCISRGPRRIHYSTTPYLYTW